MINLKALILAHRQNIGRRDRRLRRIRAVRPSHAAELFYKAELLRLVRRMVKVKNETLLPVLRRTRTMYEYTKKDAAPVRDASYIEMIQAGIDEMAEQFTGIQHTATRLAQLAVQKAAGESDDQFKNAVKQAIGIDISPVISSGQIGDEIELAVRANVNLITSIPNQYFDRIEQSIWTNTGQGMRYDAIEADLLRIDGVTESRAKLIARDQVGKINGAITQARQTSLGIDKYVWRTSMDERVRDSHADKEGQVFSWDDPPADTGHPGEDIQCRCTAEPYIDLDQEEEDNGIVDDPDAEAEDQ